MRFANSLRNGLVGAWCPSVSGWGGNVLRDLSGQGNHGTLTNMDPATDWIVSGGKQALDFDGVDDYVQASTKNELRPIGHFTLSAWLKVNNHNVTSAIAGTMAYGPDRGYWLAYDANTIFFDVPFDSNTFVRLSPSKAIPLNEWHCISACYIPSQSLSIFYDGYLLAQTTTSIPSILFRNTMPFRLGARPDSGFYAQAQLDDIRVYNRALSPNEIRLLASERGIGLKPERKRRYVQGQTFTAARLRRQSLIGSGVY